MLIPAKLETASILHFINKSLTENQNVQSHLVTSADIATPILAVIMIFVVFMAIQTTLLYSIVDFMAPAALVTAIRHVTESQSTDSQAIFMLLAGLFSIFCRIYICFDDKDSQIGVLYSSDLDHESNERHPMSHLAEYESLKKLQQVVLSENEELNV